MNKYEVKEYFEKIYNVPVRKVNTVIQAGKVKRFGRFSPVQLPDVKKAYVFFKETSPPASS
eukprot:CAMPEP_0184512496 /NCGR_PEP_ID=MMETSP0198_2-20121128/2908_1 /TAXON_ID=1112570 /ORGANISM="Thraustochytrium sp., Strain LLF1b" /LENGTH=60 /DNA_ID=CAMNT_0026902517 /DNA_START=410 /DNA_END=592 /DNA_ORIENTATION=+